MSQNKTGFHIVDMSFSEIYKTHRKLQTSGQSIYTARFRLDRLLFLRRELSGTCLLTLEA